MLFFFVGIAVGTVLLVYGTKKGWLSGKIEMLERPEEERSIKDIVEEDKESVDPKKSFYEKFQERADLDPTFKENLFKMNQKRKEAMFRGLSAKDKENLEKYLTEEIEKARNQEGSANSYEGFRSYSCEMFVISALLLFLWWGISQHTTVINPMTVGKTLADGFATMLGAQNNMNIPKPQMDEL